MGDKSDKRTDEISDHDDNNKNCCNEESKSTKKTSNETSSDRTKNMESSKTSTDSSSSSSANVASMLSVAEKTIREFYDTISKKISNFLANDMQQLKNLSKDEFTKLNASLSEYKSELEKLSQEKIKRVGEMRNTLQTRIITTEEVKNFMKYFDETIATIRRITENIVNTLRKNEVASTFVKDLQTVVADYGKKMTSATNDLYDALKEMTGASSRSSTDKDGEKLATRVQKMPISSEMQKMPSMFSKMFKKMGTGTSNSKDSGETAKKVLLPVARLREKLPTLNLSKHFNSETMYGRANVAKATYAGILLYFLYWKMKKARS